MFLPALVPLSNYQHLLHLFSVLCNQASKRRRNSEGKLAHSIEADNPPPILSSEVTTSVGITNKPVLILHLPKFPSSWWVASNTNSDHNNHIIVVPIVFIYSRGGEP